MAKQETNGDRNVFILLHQLSQDPEADKKPLPVLISRCAELDLEGRVFASDAEKIHHIPHTIDRCTNITKLRAARNFLKSIPESLSRLSLLTHVDFSSNLFTVFPIQLCSLPHIEYLDLSNNRLSCLPSNISQMVTIKVLNLGLNKLTEFHVELCALPLLEYLELWRNQLSSLPPGVSTMSSLKGLGLGSNHFTEMPTFLCALPQIEDLNLGHNKISHLPPEVGKMTSLKVLRVYNNCLTHLPHQLVQLPLLERLNVERNPLVQPPRLVCTRGKNAIFRYLHNLRESNTVKNCRVQLNLLGETESGKSSLGRSLRHWEPVLTEKADRTRVVEQYEWDPEEGITFNVNDFGGHDVYKVGHPLFMSKNGLVLVAFDVSIYDINNTEHYDKYIGNWVDKVFARHPNSTVALVGTHLDQTTVEDAKKICNSIQEEMGRRHLDRQLWEKTYADQVAKKIKALDQSRDITLVDAYQSKMTEHQKLVNQRSSAGVEIFVVSSAHMSGFDDLKSYLVEQAKKRWTVLPNSWSKAARVIYKKMHEHNGNTLRLDEIKSSVLDNAPLRWKASSVIGLKSNEDEAQALSDILSFLASRGDIVWFDTSPILRKTIFHRQEVLGNLLRAVLNHDMDEVLDSVMNKMAVTHSKPTLDKAKEDVLKRGMLSAALMSALWRPFGLTATEEEAMIELLQKLELCYQTTRENTGNCVQEKVLQFPWLLKEERPSVLEEKWPERLEENVTQITLNVYFPYKCPEGLFEKLSVRQHTHLGLYSGRRQDWKDGVYAETESCRMQLTRRKVSGDWMMSASVRGQHLPDLWHVLLRTHEDLMDILEEDWPGVPYDKYLVCAHCASLGVQEPTLFPGELIDQPPNQSTYLVPCEKTDVMVPASLIYPSPSISGMKKQQRHSLKQHTIDLIQAVTLPCLGYILDLFIQEGIITHREAEYINTAPSVGGTGLPVGAAAAAVTVSPEKTGALLNIMLNKEERAFYLLCDCLKKYGQGFIAEQLKRYDCR